MSMASTQGQQAPPVDGRVDTTGLGRLLAWVERRHLRLVVALALAAALAAGVVAASGGDRVSFADEEDYLAIATNLANSGAYSLDGVEPTAFRPPGLAMLLSVVARIDPGLVTLRVANALLFGVVVLLAGLLARRIAGPIAAVAAAGLTAASPVGIFTAAKLYPQTLASVLLLASVLALVASVDADGRSRWTRAGLGGLALGCLALTVPNHGVTLVVGVAWLAWRLRRAAVVPALVVLVAAAIPIGAWTVRNAVQMDGFVPFSTNGGINLLLGNTDGAGADTGTLVDIGEQIGEANDRGLDEVDKDRYLQEQALEWIAEDPPRAAHLYAAKVLNTFNVRQEMATADQQPSAATTLLLALSYLPLLAAFLARQVLARWLPLRRGEGLLILVFWANVAATAIAFTRIRFRVPLDPVMAVVVATAAATLLQRRRTATLGGTAAPEEVAG